MSKEPIDLDARRTAAEKIAAEFRRHSQNAFEAGKDAMLLRLHNLEAQFLSEPAETWRDVAAKAHYVIRRYLETPEAQDPRRRELIERVLSDIASLSETESGGR